MFMWFRMILTAARLAWPHLLAPWRSPLLRWRMETYGLCDARGHMLHAADITPARFFQFVSINRVALLRFLRWAARL
jgi:hypothetical protein